MDLGGAPSTVTLLAAGLVLAYGVWSGRRDPGTLDMAVLSGLLLVLLAPTGWTGPVFRGPLRFAGALEPFALLTGLSLLASFLPLQVAVSWMEVTRGQAPSG